MHDSSIVPRSGRTRSDPADLTGFSLSPPAARP